MFHLSVQDIAPNLRATNMLDISLASQSLEPVIDQMEIHRVYSGYTATDKQSSSKIQRL